LSSGKEVKEVKEVEDVKDSEGERFWIGVVVGFLTQSALRRSTEFTERSNPRAQPGMAVPR